MRFELLGIASLGGLFFILAVVSGPAVGAVNLSPDPPTQPTEGTLTVDTIEFNQTELRIEQNESGGYYVKTPPVYVDAGSIRGRPVVNYQFSNANLTLLHFEILYPQAPSDRFLAGKGRNQLPQWAPTNESYQAKLQVKVRETDGSRTLLERQVTIVTPSNVSETVEGEAGSDDQS